MIKINLVSEGKRPVVSRKTKEKLGIAGLTLGEGVFLLALLLGALSIGGFWWYLRGEIQDREVSIAAAQEEVGETPQVLQQVEDYKGKKEQIGHKIAVINQRKNDRWGPVRILERASSALPERPWLDRLTLESSNVTVHGRAF